MKQKNYKTCNHYCHFKPVVYIDPISKKKILRKGAYGEIAQAVQELLEQL
jgi:hypothetical protein